MSRQKNNKPNYKPNPNINKKRTVPSTSSERHSILPKFPKPRKSTGLIHTKPRHVPLNSDDMIFQEQQREEREKLAEDFGADFGEVRKSGVSVHPERLISDLKEKEKINSNDSDSKLLGKKRKNIWSHSENLSESSDEEDHQQESTMGDISSTKSAMDAFFDEESCLKKNNFKVMKSKENKFLEEESYRDSTRKLPLLQPAQKRTTRSMAVDVKKKKSYSGNDGKQLSEVRATTTLIPILSPWITSNISSTSEFSLLKPVSARSLSLRNIKLIPIKKSSEITPKPKLDITTSATSNTQINSNSIKDLKQDYDSSNLDSVDHLVSSPFPSTEKEKPVPIFPRKANKLGIRLIPIKPVNPTGTKRTRLNIRLQPIPKVNATKVIEDKKTVKENEEKSSSNRNLRSEDAFTRMKLPLLIPFKKTMADEIKNSSQKKLSNSVERKKGLEDSESVSKEQPINFSPKDIQMGSESLNISSDGSESSEDSPIDKTDKTFHGRPLRNKSETLKITSNSMRNLRSRDPINNATVRQANMPFNVTSKGVVESIIISSDSEDSWQSDEISESEEIKVQDKEKDVIVEQVDVRFIKKLDSVGSSIGKTGRVGNSLKCKEFNVPEETIKTKSVEKEQVEPKLFKSKRVNNKKRRLNDTPEKMTVNLRTPESSPNKYKTQSNAQETFSSFHIKLSSMKKSSVSPVFTLASKTSLPAQKSPVLAPDKSESFVFSSSPNSKVPTINSERKSLADEATLIPFASPLKRTQNRSRSPNKRSIGNNSDDYGNRKRRKTNSGEPLFVYDDDDDDDVSEEHVRKNSSSNSANSLPSIIDREDTPEHIREERDFLNKLTGGFLTVKKNDAKKESEGEESGDELFMDASDILDI